MIFRGLFIGGEREFPLGSRSSLHVNYDLNEASLATADNFRRQSNGVVL